MKKKLLIGLAIAVGLALGIKAATTLTSQLGISLALNLSGPASVGTAQYNPGLTALLSAALANGSGADKASKVSASQVSLAAGAGELFDAYAPGTDPLGNTISFSKLRVMIIQILGNTNVYTETDYLDIGGNSASTALSLFPTNMARFRLYSGTANMPGTFFICEGGSNGWAVSSGARYLAITNGGATNILYNRVFIGE